GLWETLSVDLGGLLKMGRVHVRQYRSLATRLSIREIPEVVAVLNGYSSYPGVVFVSLFSPLKIIIFLPFEHRRPSVFSGNIMNEAELSSFLVQQAQAHGHSVATVHSLADWHTLQEHHRSTS